jgi:putative ATP-binding cassette transporter
MRLTDIVTFNEQKNVIKATLSKGQQKRLALIYALMEQKEIIILDEWAAEQDPVFRAFFYKVLVPEMKRMGKTVIAVTHDDAYFDYAERVLRFDYGRVQSDVRQPAMAV